MMAGHKMRMAVVTVAITALLLVMLLGLRAMPAYALEGCDEGTHMAGATYRICMPATWNNDLVIYAYGYVSPNRPVEIPDEQIKPPGAAIGIDEFLVGQGYAFAVSDYGTNGLAILPGKEHIVDLVDVFTAQKGAPERVLLVGLSEGGQIITLLLEERPDLFAGGLAACAPTGSFSGQNDYFGDVRVLFDYFFPGLMPGTPVDIPPSLIDTWETGFYSDTIRPVLTDPLHAATVDELLTVAGVAFEPGDAAAKEEIVQNLLWYNVMGTNDAVTKLGGQPFDNSTRVYAGASDDEALNAGVARYAADAIALQRMADEYETTGSLPVPLVTLHTTGDPTVPYWQATAYAEKVTRMRRADFLTPRSAPAYGHCAFNPLFDLLPAVNALQAAVANPPAIPHESYLPLILQP